MKLTPWLVVPYAPHAAMRCLEGTDGSKVEHRIAFIEKTPRVRIAPWSGDILTDWRNWIEGEKGPGGAGGDNPANELYGHYPPSRAWCDARLKAMGYELA